MVQLLHTKYKNRRKYCSRAKYSWCWASLLAWKPDQDLGLVLSAEASHCYLAFKRREKKKKQSQAEKKEGMNKTADENRGKVLEAAGCGGVGTVWAEPAARSKEHRRLTAGREVEGKPEHGFLKACLQAQLAFTFAFAKPISPRSSPGLASPLRRVQSSATWHFGLQMRPSRIY